MHIGIDISTILNHGNDIGSGRYIFNLLKNLFIIDRTDTFILTGRYAADEYLPLLDEIKKDYIQAGTTRKNKDAEKLLKDNAINDDSAHNAFSGEQLKNLQFKLFKTTPKKLSIWNKLYFPPIEMFGFKADIFHCPDFLIPPTFNKKIILTVNDLAFVRFPHFNFEWFVKKYTKEVKRNASVAKRIIAISESTKNDIVEFFNINENKIDVTYLAADEAFRKLGPDEIDYNLKSKFKIKNKFILSVGTIEPRKNYVTLIRAFNILKDNLPEFEYQLVIAGRTGWKSEAAYEEFGNSPYKEDIIFTGRIPDKELIHLYNMAELFVYPSIFEGFGLPVVEAMQCGLPVAASCNSSIPELIDYKRTLFNPADEQDIAAKILMILSDDILKKELSVKSIKNAERFSWRKTAEKTLEIYREAQG
ncbi:MAG: glycosyltransferase family 4 protein [Actinobacteria bacterium]|nr:glycosyltransferase family 4 protein [Actinomycetota bacterium]